MRIIYEEIKEFKVVCEECDGSGKVPTGDSYDPYGHYECEECNGRGWFLAEGYYEIKEDGY